MNHTRHTGRAAGFSLVELLLALTLLSMLLALAYGGLRASTRATDRGQTILEDSSRIRMAHQFVRKQINQMIPLAFEVSEDGTERSVFLGQPSSIRFVAPMPGYLGFGGPQVQELAIVRGPQGLELVLWHAVLQGFEEDKLYERDEIPLLGEIERAEFSFLVRDEEGKIAGWVNQWEDPTTLPESVALDIEFKEEVYIRWPQLTARVRVDGATLAQLFPDQAGELDYRSSIRNLIDRRTQPQ